jgi:hypothetical protein
MACRMVAGDHEIESRFLQRESAANLLDIR